MRSTSCSKRSCRHEQTNLDSSQTAHERCAPIAWLLSSLQRKHDGSRSRKRHRSSKGKGKRQGKSKGKGKGRRPGPCLLCQDPHWARECPSHHEDRASVSTHLARDTRILHRLDKLTWKVTSMTGSQVQVLLQSRFHLCRILPVLTSTESSFSILEPQCQWEALISCRESTKCTRRRVFDSLHIPCPSLRFPFVNGQEDVSTSVLPVPYFALESHILHSCAERARASAVGNRCARRFGIDHVDCSMFSESLEAGRHC